MKIQQLQVVKPALVVDVEKMLDKIRPDISNEINLFFSNAHHDHMNSIIYDIVRSFATAKLISGYDLIEIAKYAKIADNKIAQIITEIDYFNDITIITRFDELDIIEPITRLRTKANDACIERRKDLYVQKILATDDVFEIESILIKLSGQHKSYEVGIKKLIPHYKAEVDKKQTKAEIDSYIEQIKTDRSVNFSTCTQGTDFLSYCSKRAYSLDIDQTNSPDKMLKIRNSAYFLYRDLVVKCDEKLAIYVAAEIKKEPSDEGMIGLYRYITVEQDQSDFLFKCLTNFTDNLSHYWFIYQELLEKFPKDEDRLALARDKVIKSFITKTTADNNYQVIDKVINDSIKNGVRDKVMANIVKDEVVKEIFVDRIRKASIDESITSVSTFHFCENRHIYSTLIKHFFSLRPTAKQISDFGSRIISVGVSFPALTEEFYDGLDEFYAKITNDKDLILTESDLKSYFMVIKDKYTAINAKSSIIVALYKLQHDIH